MRAVFARESLAMTDNAEPAAAQPARVAALEIDGLRKVYGNGFEALKGISLAVEEALQHAPYPGGVQQILEQRREQRQLPPPVAIPLPERAKGYQVKPARLSDYDQLNTRVGGVGGVAQ